MRGMEETITVSIECKKGESKNACLVRLDKVIQKMKKG